jgi:subtilisin family serine protease
LYNTLEQTFDLSSLTSATLNFSTKYDIESGYDNGYVQVLTGSNWKTLANYTNHSDWTDKSIDLSSYVGSNVTIRFLYETDYIISYEGWYIDDIEIPEIGFYDDVESGANGWTADGWYVFTPDTPYDNHGHGTHMAGTVAGTGADGLKTGVAPGANLMAAKVIDNYGYGSMSDVVRAVEWSVENNADVVSISLGINPDDQVSNYGLLNESETAIENIYVFSNWFEGKPRTTLSPTAYQPTYILGGVALYEETHFWEAFGYGPDTLTQTFNLTGVPRATLEFKTAFGQWYDSDIGEVQASTDGESWNTLAEYRGYSDWTNDSLSLDDYAGGNVSIRFKFEPYEYGFWCIDNIEIPEIGFYDDVESGNTGWITNGWNIGEILIPLDITNADISLRMPDGTQVTGDEAEWFYDGMVPDNVWYYKYTGTTFLQNGEWDLIITSNLNGTLVYNTILLIGYPSDGTDATSQALNTAAALGVVPVVAAGNAGILGLHTIGSPGASESAITVGATVYEMDYIAWFSSRGPVGFGTDEIIKPDVVAPGTYITSTYYLGGYAGGSGTSMATPHVSGAAALLLEADPTLTPTQVKQILMDTAIDLGETGMDNNYGAGRISAYAAVNATVDLPDPIDIRPDQYELFAGATIDEIHISPFIEDQAGDAVGYADIVGVDPYLYDSGPGHLYFMIYTADAPDLSLSEFRLYMDTDKDTSTGNGVIITELGVDYYIKINGAGGYLYRWDAGEWQLVWNVYRDSYNNYVYVWVPLDAIGETVSSIEMNTVVDSFVPGGTLLDRAPDTGYGTFPWMDVTIDMVGISWNDSSGLPEQGMNVTFKVQKYRSSPYYDYVTVAKITNTTDSSGMAKASVQFDQNEIDERYYVYISDETGNEILDDVYAYADDSWQYGYEPFIVPSYKNYYAEMNSTLSVKITMVTPEWEPYNENVTLVFGDEWYDYDDLGNVSVELTPVNGTIEYDLDLSATDIDENYYNYGGGYGYIPVRILNGTLDGYDYEEYVGHIDIFEGQRYRTILSPDLTVASPGSTVDYLVEAVVSNMTVDRPVSDNLTVEVVWISEVAVKNLNLETSITNKLDLMRIQMEETGKSENLLTTKEQDKLLEVLKDAQTKNIGYNYTTFDINSNANGLAQFDINVPDDAYYGYVWVFCDADYGWYWYGDESVIIVIDNYKDLCHHPTAPESGTGFYDLYLDADWDCALVDGSIIPDENIIVKVELELYDPQQDDWIGVPNENVYLYATTGDVKMVTTDDDGEAEINFTAPSIDVLNSTWDEMSVQVWGITRLLTPNNEIAVAKDDWAYLDFTLLSNYSIPYVEINNNTLDITLEFKDSTWIDTTNVPTVLNVQKSFEWYSTKDLMSDYINSPTSTWQTSISLAEYGTYSVITSTEYPNLWGWNDYTAWWSHATFTPFDISSDIQYLYPKNINQPISVTVHDLQGNPVSGASVYIIEQEDTYYYEDEDFPSTWNHIDLATTDSTGAATLTLKTPDRDTSVNYRIGGATSKFMFPYMEIGYFSVEAPSNQPDLIVSGITLPDVINEGLPVDITVTVENIDIFTAGETTFNVLVNETVIGTANVPPLMLGDRFNDSVSWTPDTAGIYTIQANVDPVNIVFESNETNNLLSIQVEVAEHVVDNTTPIAIITQPLEGAYLKRTIDINGTANDMNFKNYTIEWKNTTVDWTEIHNSTVPVIDGTFATWNTDNLEDGDYSIRLTVADNASNLNITLINVTIDKKQPEVNITEPENDSNLKFFENIVRGEVNDDNLYSAQLIVKNETGETVNSYNLNITDGEFSKRVEFAPDQNNTLELVAVDKAENSNSTNITVFAGNNTLISQTDVTKGEPVTIDAQSETNTTIEFVSNVTISDVTFTVTAITNETQINDLNNSVFTVFGEMAVGKIVEINVTGLDVTNESEVQSVTLYLYYTMADLDLDGDGTLEPGELNEDKLYIWFNDTSHNWTKLLKGNPDWVIDNGQVKISGDNPGYIWVKVKHLSMFALVSLPEPEPTEDDGDGDNNGGGGRGYRPTPTETETAEDGEEGAEAGEEGAEAGGEGIISTPTATQTTTPEDKSGFLGFNLFTGLLVAIILAILIAVYSWQKNK